MAVRERGNAWQADVIVAGRRYRKDFRTREDALAWEAQVKAEAEARKQAEGDRRKSRRRGDPPPRPDAASSPQPPGDATKRDKPRTLGEIFERTFNRFYRGTVYEKDHWQMHQRVMDHFGANFPLSRMDTDAVDGFVETLKAQGKAGSTINGRLAALSKALRYAYDLGALPRLPRMERERLYNNRIRWLSQEEEEMLLALFRQWGRDDVADVVTVLVDTGMRQSELWALTPEDVKFEVSPSGRESGSIYIWKAKPPSKTKPVERTKNGEQRTIYMTERVARIMRARVQQTAPKEALFPYDNLWLRAPWERARAVMGLTGDEAFVPYICRHTCASRMVQRGVSVPVIQKWMGHKTIQITMRYAKIAPDNLREAAETLDGAASAA